MILVSVDIEIRNLAVVKIQYDSDSEDFKITFMYIGADVVIIEKQVPKNHWAMSLMYAMIACIDGPEVILFNPL
jgi:hypothetical protein